MDRHRNRGDLAVRGRQGPDGERALSLGEMLRQAQERIGRHDHEAALALLDEALDISPHCVPALLLAARCHRSRGDAVRALEMAGLATRWARGAEVDTAQAVRSECARAAVPDVLADVRAALRRGHLGRAVARADEIATALPDSDEVADVHAYVYERLATSPQAQARARARRGEPRLLTPQALQKVLVWLASEELEEGTAALDNRDYARAVELLDHANLIDDRCARVAYLQAAAMYATVLDEVARPRPAGLDTAPENLRRAAMLADRAGTAAELAGPARRLRTRIDELSRQVARELRVGLLQKRFDALVRRYTGRPINYFEASNLRRSLAALETRVATAHDTGTSDPDERRDLAALHTRILGLQKQVRHIV
jgi:tetratricopeptide (TPR) repeat protein